MKTLTKLSLALQQRFGQQTLHRKREMDILMLDQEQVDQYNANGKEGGLAIVYQFVVNILLQRSPQTGQALDICCGPAQLLLKTARAFPQMSFTGLDLSPRMLHYAQQNLDQAQLQNVSFQAGSMYELTHLFKNKFDLITWCDAMHHCDSQQSVIKVLNQVGQLLKENGCFFIFDFVRPKSGKLALQLAQLYAREYGDWIFQDYLDSLKAAFTYEETREILNASQLKNWLHVVPVIGNVFQVILISKDKNLAAKQIHELKYFWQRMDYQFLKMIFANRI